MKRLKYIVLIAAIAVSVSSCGIFKKDCGCPHFGMARMPAKVNRA